MIQMIFLILSEASPDVGFFFLTQSKEKQNGLHWDQFLIEKFCGSVFFFFLENLMSCVYVSLIREMAL